MKHIFLTLSIIAIFLLTSCGSKSDHQASNDLIKMLDGSAGCTQKVINTYLDTNNTFYQMNRDLGHFSDYVLSDAKIYEADNESDYIETKQGVLTSKWRIQWHLDANYKRTNKIDNIEQIEGLNK